MSRSVGTDAPAWLQQVLDLDGDVVGELRKFAVQRFDDAPARASGR